MEITLWKYDYISAWYGNLKKNQISLVQLGYLPLNYELKPGIKVDQILMKQNISKEQVILAPMASLFQSGGLKGATMMFQMTSDGLFQYFFWCRQK